MARAPVMNPPRRITVSGSGPLAPGEQPPTAQAADPVVAPVPTEASPAMIEETDSIHGSSVPRDDGSTASISVGFFSTGPGARVAGSCSFGRSAVEVVPATTPTVVVPLEVLVPDPDVVPPPVGGGGGSPFGGGLVVGDGAGEGSVVGDGDGSGDGSGLGDGEGSGVGDGSGDGSGLGLSAESVGALAMSVLRAIEPAVRTARAGSTVRDRRVARQMKAIPMFRRVRFTRIPHLTKVP
jgi:hypothetical protein